MDAEARGGRADRKTDRHGWNSYEHYRQIHETRLVNHPFVNHARPNTIAFDFFELEGDVLLAMVGEIYCLHGVVVEVEKYFDTKTTRDGRLQVRCFSYRYNARLPGKFNILRYDTGHDFDEYHRHRFDPKTGQQIRFELLTREQFPLLSEILDELERIFQAEQERS